MNIIHEVQNLKINVSHLTENIVGELIEAEIFSIRRYRNFQKIEIEKFKNFDNNDKRVWIKVVVYVKNESLNLFQFRPFIDRSCVLIPNGEFIKFEKQYFVGEELED